MEKLLREVERAIQARGWSARQASMEAVGSPELIRSMRRGQVPSVERVEALCKALDLEFYVGPPRAERPVDSERLEQALETTERALMSTGRRMSLPDKARAVAAVYDLIGEGRGRANAGRVLRLLEAMAKGRAVERSAASER